MCLCVPDPASWVRAMNPTRWARSRSRAVVLANNLTVAEELWVTAERIRACAASSNSKVIAMLVEKKHL